MIDHSAHPHPSTPTARALCRANGGTGVTTKTGTAAPKTSSAKKKTPARQSVGNHTSSLTEAKVPVVAKKKEPAAKTSTTKKVNSAPRVITDISTGKPISRDEAAARMFGTGGTAKKTTAKKTTTPKVSAPMTAEKHSRIMDKMGDEDSQVEALLSTPVGIDGDEDRGFNSPEEKKAAKDYIGSGYGFVNSFLRGQNEGNDKAKEDIKQLDAIMARSKTTEDIGVYRGVGNGRLMFGDSLDGDMTGLEWREKGYSSTTVNEDVADDFTTADGDDDDEDDEDGGGGGGDSGPIKMRIVLPKGTSAFQASDIDDEAEMIVDRNSAFRVIKDRGVDDMGVRVLDVQLLG